MALLHSNRVTSTTNNNGKQQSERRLGRLENSAQVPRAQRAAESVVLHHSRSINRRRLVNNTIRRQRGRRSTVSGSVGWLGQKCLPLLFLCSGSRARSSSRKRPNTNASRLAAQLDLQGRPAPCSPGPARPARPSTDPNGPRRPAITRTTPTRLRADDRVLDLHRPARIIRLLRRTHRDPPTRARNLARPPHPRSGQTWRGDALQPIQPLDQADQSHRAGRGAQEAAGLAANEEGEAVLPASGRSKVECGRQYGEGAKTGGGGCVGAGRQSDTGWFGTTAAAATEVKIKAAEEGREEVERLPP